MTRDEAYQKLLKVLGQDALTQDPAELQVYGQDWSKTLTPDPWAVAFPRSTQQVSEILAICSEAKIPVVPSGGRTGLSGGAVATKKELVLNLSKMNRISQVDLAAQTVRVQAGAVTEAVHQHCEKHGLTWPVSFASQGSSEIGGNLATNAGGVHVIRYGMSREWVQSIQAVLMSGEILELNGELEKNNSGYDLRQLLIGSEGTLAVITEATLKLTRLPGELELVFFSLKDLSSVIDLFTYVRKAPFDLHAFECLTLSCYQESLRHFGVTPPLATDAQAYAILEFESHVDADAVQAWLERAMELDGVQDAVMPQSARESKEIWKLREGVTESVGSLGRLVYKHDVSVPVSKLAEFARTVLAEYSRSCPEFEVFLFGHIGDGNVHISLRQPESWDRDQFLKQCHASDQALFQFIQAFGGSVSAEHGIGSLKRHGLAYTRSKAEIELMKGIKRAFDPQGLLNPGKLL